MEHVSRVEFGGAWGIREPSNRFEKPATEVVFAVPYQAHSGPGEISLNPDGSDEFTFDQKFVVLDDPDDTSWVQVPSSADPTCALKESGWLWCWKVSPRRVEQFPEGSVLINYNDYTCVLETSGKLSCHDQESLEFKEYPGRWKSLLTGPYDTQGLFCGLNHDGYLTCVTYDSDVPYPEDDRIQEIMDTSFNGELSAAESGGA
jgi:hypothetical protein